MGSPELEATFDTIVNAFLFLDKNGDGKLNKKDMIKALNEACPWEKSPAHVTKSRFSIANFTQLYNNFFPKNVVAIDCTNLDVILVVNAEEMDWDNNGKVSFREFLFAFIGWVGFDSDEEKAEMEYEDDQDSIEMN